MKHEKTILWLTVAIFAGMVGIYFAAWRAYQQYQAVQSQYSSGGAVGLLASLFTQPKAS